MLARRNLLGIAVMLVSLLSPGCQTLDTFVSNPDVQKELIAAYREHQQQRHERKLWSVGRRVR